MGLWVQRLGVDVYNVSLGGISAVVRLCRCLLIAFCGYVQTC